MFISILFAGLKINKDKRKTISILNESCITYDIVQLLKIVSVAITAIAITAFQFAHVNRKIIFINVISLYSLSSAFNLNACSFKGLPVKGC